MNGVQKKLEGVTLSYSTLSNRAINLRSSPYHVILIT